MTTSIQSDPNPSAIPTVAVIGCGNMSRAMLGGLVGTEIDQKTHFMCSSRTLESANALASMLQSATAMVDNIRAVSTACKVILSIKPQQAEAVCRQIAPFLTEHCHVISIMAGLGTDTIAEWCGVTKMSRIMPNTPAFIGVGMAGIYHSSGVSRLEAEFIVRMMNQVGTSIVVESEDKMHAITAISGSGPAYFFHFMHHLQEVAIRLGFSPEEARQLVNQTALGATRLVAQSGESALGLRQKITSPGGTTEQAIRSFESSDIGQTIAKAVESCYRQSVDLSTSLATKKPTQSSN